MGSKVLIKYRLQSVVNVCRSFKGLYLPSQFLDKTFPVKIFVKLFLFLDT